MRIGEFVADLDRNTVISTDGSETRLEPKVMAVLAALADAPGQVVCRDALVDTIWQVNYGADGGPTRAVSKLRKVFGDTSGKASYIETIPKRGYRMIAPVAPVRAQPTSAPVLPLDGSASSARNGTRVTTSAPTVTAANPTGPAQVEPVPWPASHRHGGARRTALSLLTGNNWAYRPRPLDYLVLFALLAAASLAISAWISVRPEALTQQAAAAARPERKTVALLPFKFHHANHKDAHLADGFHDALLTQLSKISSLHVISRTSVMQYRETTKPTPVIASELRAAVILEGSMQRAGNRIRINVQLIDGAADTLIWAESFDHDLATDDLFAVQSEITRAIARALETALTPAEKHVLKVTPTKNPAAYEAYIRGRIIGARSIFSKDLSQRGIDEFDEAIRLDPGFGLAYTARALAYLRLHWAFRMPEDGLDAETALRQAEALAPDAAETLFARGLYHYYRYDYALADEFLKRALEKAPNNAEIWMTIGSAARRDGRFDDHLAAHGRALDLDPRNLEVTLDLANTHMLFGRFKTAEALIARAKLIDPTNFLVLQRAAALRMFQGDAEGAWREFSAPVANPDVRHYRGWAFAAWQARDPEKMEAALHAWPERLRRPKWFPDYYAYYQAYLLEMRGRTDEAQKLFGEIKARLDAQPRIAGWHKKVSPLWLPEAMRDLDAVRAAEADYRANAPKDALMQLVHFADFAEAFARAGDPETAFDYMEAYTEKTSPAAYLYFSVLPELDGLRDHPRFLALKAKYAAWTPVTPN